MVAWFEHRTKRGTGHNWEGTSGSAEGDTFDHVLRNAKEEGFNITDRQGQFYSFLVPSALPRVTSDLLQQPLLKNPTQRFAKYKVPGEFDEHVYYQGPTCNY